MTQVEKLIKIIMPDLLKYLKMKESGELAQKRLDSQAVPTIFSCFNIVHCSFHDFDLFFFFTAPVAEYV